MQRFWLATVENPGGEGRRHWPETLSVLKRHGVRWLLGTPTLGHDLQVFLFLYVHRK